MRVAVAQIGTDPGAFKANSAHVRDYINQARQAGVQLIVFPEGCIPGYAHLDLVFERNFARASRAAVAELAADCTDITAVIGFIDYAENQQGPAGKPLLYNSAAVLSAGKIQAIRDKTLLPEYDIFSEYRYFTPGQRTGLVDIGGYQTGIGICEDLWSSGYNTKVYPKLLSQGANLLINISASPFHIDKAQQRYDLVQQIINGKPAAFIYANLVGSYDGYDGEIVFDGQSMIWNSRGQLCAVASGFQEQLLIADLHSSSEISWRPAPAAEQLYQALILGIREYFRRCGFERAYIGISGGIDSALVAALVVVALGSDKVIGVTMPSEITSSETLSDSLELAKRLGMRIDQRPIKSEYQSWFQAFRESFNRDPGRMTKQNKQARIRGSILMEYSNEDTSGIVVSTGNKTELALGYCTLYGDMCGGFAAISDVSKERVYLLSRYINQLHGRELIPQSIIDRTPTAELEPGQTDAANLPADYDIISPLVDALIDQQIPQEELYGRYSKTIVDQTARLIRVNEFKRRQAAPGIRVTSRAFGIGRRIPIAHGYSII